MACKACEERREAFFRFMLGTAGTVRAWISPVKLEQDSMKGDPLENRVLAPDMFLKEQQQYEHLPRENKEAALPTRLDLQKMMPTAYNPETLAQHQNGEDLREQDRQKREAFMRAKEDARQNRKRA